jgi:hypothetical protein
MCGRYTLAILAKKPAEEFGFDAFSVDLPPTTTSRRRFVNSPQNNDPRCVEPAA